MSLAAHHVLAGAPGWRTASSASGTSRPNRCQQERSAVGGEVHTIGPGDLFPGPGSDPEMTDDDAVRAGCFGADPLDERVDADLLRRRHAQPLHLGQERGDELLESAQPYEIGRDTTHGRLEPHRGRL